MKTNVKARISEINHKIDWSIINHNRTENNRVVCLRHIKLALFNREVRNVTNDFSGYLVKRKAHAFITIERKEPLKYKDFELPKLLWLACA